MQSKPNYTISFINGPVETNHLNACVRACSEFPAVGAHSVFMGQVREDRIEGKPVEYIEFSANEEMAHQVIPSIINDAALMFGIKTATIVHSTGKVKKGELCLLVFVGCGHRKESFGACEYIVERFKNEAPVWGKEILSDHTGAWKVNT